MWIRSQDKEILINATCICLGSENHICAYASNAEGDNWYIGKYSTREKALKVLGEDMIGQQINIFELSKPQYKITKPIRLIELFAGIGSQAKALENLNANFEITK